jgi:hypothetical protein
MQAVGVMVRINMLKTDRCAEQIFRAAGWRCLASVEVCKDEWGDCRITTIVRIESAGH